MSLLSTVMHILAQSHNSLSYCMMLVTLSPLNSAISSICNVCIFSHDSIVIEGERGSRTAGREKEWRSHPHREVQRKRERERVSQGKKEKGREGEREGTIRLGGGSSDGRICFMHSLKKANQ